jgi:hypothetical protein
MTVVGLDHDRLLKSSTRRELGIEHIVQLLQSTPTGLDTKGEPDNTIDEVQPDEDEVVVPVDSLEGDGRDVGVVQVGAVG